MAAVVNKLGNKGNVNSRAVTLTGPASYPTGGFALAEADVQLNRIDWVSMGCNGTHWFVYDYVNKKVKMFVITTGVEVANTVNTSASSAVVMIEGS